MPEALYKLRLDKSQKRNSRITKEDEEEIRRLYELGIYSQYYLAKKFNISQACVCYLVNDSRRAKKTEYQKYWAREHKLPKEEQAKRQKEVLEYKKQITDRLEHKDEKDSF